MSGEPTRTRAWTVPAVLLLIMTLLAVQSPGVALAAFAAAARTGTSQWSSAVLDPPAGLTASRPGCDTEPAPAFVSQTGATDDGTADDLITVGRPAGWVAGDTLVAILLATTGDVHSAPAGWTRVSELTEGTSVRLTVFRSVLPASPPADFTFSWNYTGSDGSTVDAALTVLAYRGADPADPLAAFADATDTSTSIAAPAVTTTRSRSLRVFLAFSVQDTGMTTPAGMTTRNAVFLNWPGNFLDQSYLGLWDEVQPAAGSTPARATVLDGGSHRWYAASLVLQPPSDPAVQLSWTPTGDTDVTGYRLTRTGGGTATVPVAGRPAAGHTDSAAPRAALTYDLASAMGTSSWTSAGIGASVGACP